MKNKKVIIGTLLFVAAGLILAFLLVGSNGDDLQGRLRVREATPSLLENETFDEDFKVIGGSEFEMTADEGISESDLQRLKDQLQNAHNLDPEGYNNSKVSIKGKARDSGASESQVKELEDYDPTK